MKYLCYQCGQIYTHKKKHTVIDCKDYIQFLIDEEIRKNEEVVKRS